MVSPSTPWWFPTSAGTTLANPDSLPQVPAEHSDVILDSWGVNLHQSFPLSSADGGVYGRQNHSAILDLMEDLGVRIYRDVLKDVGNANGQRSFIATAYNTYRMRGSFVMGRRGSGPTYDAQDPSYRADLEAFVRGNPELFVQMEGYNEPNFVTSGRPSDWDEQVVDHARWIWDLSAEVDMNDGVFIPTASASLHNVTSTRLGDLAALNALGWADHSHRANVHCYPGSNRPSGHPNSNSDIAQRTEQMYSVGGFDKTWQAATNTESGYFTTTGTLAERAGGSTSTGQWVPYEVHANYITKHLMEWMHLDRQAATPLGCLHQFYYELLDDPNAAGGDREANLGLVEVVDKTDPDTWTVKPAFTAMKNFLAEMADPGTPYCPAPLRLAVTEAGEPTVKWRLYGRRSGVYQLVLWRDQGNAWTEAQGYKWPSETGVRVTTAGGSVLVPVGAEIVVHTITS